MTEPRSSACSIICLTENILEEYAKVKGGFSSTYIKRGKEGYRVMSGALSVTMVFNPVVESANSRPSSRPGTADSSKGKTIRSKAVTSKTTATTTVKATATVSLSTPTSSMPSSSFNNSDFEENCYGKLELKRLQLKKDFGMASVADVCSNTTLREMARLLPVDVEAFSKQYVFGAFRSVPYCSNFQSTTQPIHSGTTATVLYYRMVMAQCLFIHYYIYQVMMSALMI